MDIQFVFHPLIVALGLNIVSLGSLAVEKCPGDAEFSDAIQGKSLEKHTHKTLRSIVDEDGCQLHCFLEDDCISYNFYQEDEICELSRSDHTIHPGDMVDTPNAVYRKMRNVYSSCKEALDTESDSRNRAYNLLMDGQVTKTYCHMSHDTCDHQGGWTLAMKIDGSKNDFEYNSALWSNNMPYNVTAGQTGFDNYQTKMPSYWTMPFDKICVGLKVNNHLNWVVIPYKAISLYDVIADGKYRPTNIGRAKWLSLIGGSSLQPYCNDEGFNTYGFGRLGIRSNQQNDCKSCNSALGLGIRKRSSSPHTCGNYCAIKLCRTPVTISAFGYLMIK